MLSLFLLLFLLLLLLMHSQSVLVSQMRNLMTPSTRASRKIFFAKFDATGDLALLRHPKVSLRASAAVVKDVANVLVLVVAVGIMDAIAAPLQPTSARCHS